MIAAENGGGTLQLEVPRIDINGHRLGSVDGFYPVEGIEDPEVPQLWIPKALQYYESLCLAQKIADSGVEYDAVFGLTRGANDLAATIAYYLKIKNVYFIQTDGYDENNQPLEIPRIINTTDPETIIKTGKHGAAPRVLKVDELVDKAGSMMVTDEWIADHVDFDYLHNAVIYDKVQDREHETDIKYVGRPVRNMWLDHESQADGARRNKRLEELRPYAGEIASAMGWLSVQPVDPNLVPTMVARSSITRDVETFQFIAAGH